MTLPDAVGDWLAMLCRAFGVQPARLLITAWDLSWSMTGGTDGRRRLPGRCNSLRRCRFRRGARAARPGRALRQAARHRRDSSRSAARGGLQAPPGPRRSSQEQRCGQSRIGSDASPQPAQRAPGSSCVASNVQSAPAWRCCSTRFFWLLRRCVCRGDHDAPPALMMSRDYYESCSP